MFNNSSDSNVVFAGENFVLPKNRNNAGTYRCTADNGIGNAVNHTVNVAINCECNAFRPVDVHVQCVIICLFESFLTS